MTLPGAFVLEDWSDPLWRLNNIYWVLTDQGQEVPFVLRPEQEDLVRNLHARNVVPKSRQHGITTVVELIGLDQCIWNRNFKAATIAHTLRDAKEIFRTKVQFPWSKLPAALRDAIGVRTETADELIFGNGSAISVTTSVRSATLQLLHISEFGAICARTPEKAREIVTGGFPAVVQDGGTIIVESTGKGQSGRFYDMTMAALRLQQSGDKPTDLDFRLHFYAWWQKKANVLDPTGVAIPADMARYFKRLEDEKGIHLTPEQKAWYVKTAESLDEDMKSEHPSYVEECFETAIEGAIYAKQMEMLRRMERVGHFPWDPRYPVNTFWDFGVDDATSIWFHQRIAGMNRLIGYYENQGFGFGHYVNECNSRGYTWGRHYIPHDGRKRQMDVEVKTPKSILAELGFRNTVVVERTPNINTGIDQTRTFLLTCEIDAKGCVDGIRALDNYQREWDEKLVRFSNFPLHNWASHGADAIRTGAQGYSPDEVYVPPESVYTDDVFDEETGY